MSSLQDIRSFFTLWDNTGLEILWRWFSSLTALLVIRCLNLRGHDRNIHLMSLGHHWDYLVLSIHISWQGGVESVTSEAVLYSVKIMMHKIIKIVGLVSFSQAVVLKGDYFPWSLYLVRQYYSLAYICYSHIYDMIQEANLGLVMYLLWRMELWSQNSLQKLPFLEIWGKEKLKWLIQVIFFFSVVTQDSDWLEVNKLNVREESGMWKTETFHSVQVRKGQGLEY